MHKSHAHAFIYRSHLHQFVTIFLLILPFTFFVFFARLTAISLAELFNNIGVSVMRLSVAYVIALCLAWTCAILFYRGRRAIVALPLFDVLQSFPTFAVLPFATVFFGSSHMTVIFFLIITIIWPIFFSIINSLHMIKHDWREAVEISQLSGMSYLKMFLLPITIPGLVTGSIIGLGEAWEALIATEIIVGTKTGLGNFFNLFSRDPQITAFGILGFLILIFSINKLMLTPLSEWSHRKMEE